MESKAGFRASGEEDELLESWVSMSYKVAATASNKQHKNKNTKHGSLYVDQGLWRGEQFTVMLSSLVRRVDGIVWDAKKRRIV